LNWDEATEGVLLPAIVLDGVRDIVRDLGAHVLEGPVLLGYVVDFRQAMVSGVVWVFRVGRSLQVELRDFLEDLLAVRERPFLDSPRKSPTRVSFLLDTRLPVTGVPGIWYLYASTSTLCEGVMVPLVLVRDFLDLPVLDRRGPVTEGAFSPNVMAVSDFLVLLVRLLTVGLIFD